MRENPKILLATDLGPRCDRALERALALSASLPGALVAVHVIERRVEDGQAEDEVELRRAILGEFPELAGPGRLVIAHGPVPATLARLSAEMGCDLILTGVARYDSLGDFVLGTTVDHLVRHAAVPVLVVKRRPRAPYRHLLVATDFSSCSRDALIRAAALLPDAAITLVHAYHVPYEAWLQSEDVRREVEREARREMDDFLAGMPDRVLAGRIGTRLDYGEPQEVVCRELHATDADLLVLGTHGRSGFSHALIGCWAAALLESADRDVLMVREAR